MKLRPHHLIDIVTSYGHGDEFKPHPYGHALHIVAKKVLCDTSIKIKFVCASDDICRPCRHLQENGKCDDILPQLAKPTSKQTYNDSLDSKLFPYLKIKRGTRLTMHKFLTILSKHVPGIEKLCTHPKEKRKSRLKGLERGLLKLGIVSRNRLIRHPKTC
ncbi:MAG: DUF1284 domain-containing protein [Kiritimatiellae bacterium]|nr:DUF1284 domain-containing protein [Kiritimatiellia bacterium]MDD5520962.1 DUF1284 domain-containing protein [Kiritimatiellia bacterium]